MASTNIEIIEALHIIKGVCETHQGRCTTCPLNVFMDDSVNLCGMMDIPPSKWKIAESIDSQSLL